MKTPKIILKTGLWDKKDWQPKINKLVIIHIVIFGLILFVTILSRPINIGIMMLSIIALLINYLITISYTRWEKKNDTNDARKRKLRESTKNSERKSEEKNMGE